MGDAVTSARDFSNPTGDWNHQRVQLGDRVIHYVREGRGPALFLLHGWPEFWWGWHRNIPELASRFDVLAPDLRGFGDSPVANSQPLGPDEHARDIIDLADALGIARFGIVSHDVGAYVAQAIARSSPERLLGLFFFNGPYPGIGRRWVDASQVKEIWYQSFNQQPGAPQLVGRDRDTCRTYFGGILAHWTHAPGALDAEVDHFVDNFMKPGNVEGGFAWYRASHEARMALVRDGAPVLPKIDVRSRFYWGRHDPVIPSSWTDLLPEYFRDPVVEIAEGAGHFVHLETPLEANRRVLEFFAY